MQGSSNKDVVVFSRDGSKFGALPIPSMIYLDSEKEWIEKRLNRSTSLDGIAILIDWHNRSISILRK